MISLLWRAADRLRRRRYPDDHGKIGEDLAFRYLRSHGCTIAARNYRTHGAGEVDLIAWHGPLLVFVEVKTRATADYGTPDSAVDTEKQTKILRAAADYARRRNTPLESARFDIVSVLLTTPPTLEWHQDVFSVLRRHHP